MSSTASKGAAISATSRSGGNVPSADGPAVKSISTECIAENVSMIVKNKTEPGDRAGEKKGEN